MHKQINISQLRQGMYLERLPGSWLSHPFWKTSRLLNSAEEIALVRESGVRHAVIDTAKGLDVEVEEADIAAPAEADIAAPADAAPACPAPAPIADMVFNGHSSTRRSHRAARLHLQRLTSTNLPCPQLPRPGSCPR